MAARKCVNVDNMRVSGVRARALRFSVPANIVNVMLSSFSPALALHLDTRPDSLQPCQDVVRCDDECLRVRTTETHVRRRELLLRAHWGGVQVHAATHDYILTLHDSIPIYTLLYAME